MPDDDFFLTLPSQKHRHPNPIYTFIIHPESVFIHFFYAFSAVQCETSPTSKNGLVVQRMPRVSEGRGTLVT